MPPRRLVSASGSVAKHSYSACGEASLRHLILDPTDESGIERELRESVR